MTTSLDIELTFGDWNADPSCNQLRIDDRQVRIEPQTMDVLVFLAQHPGQVLSKSELIQEVWDGRAVSDDALVVAIYELRKALGDNARQPTYIETIPRRGYRWLLPTEIHNKQTALELAQRSKPSWRAATIGMLGIAAAAATVWFLSSSEAKRIVPTTAPAIQQQTVETQTVEPQTVETQTVEVQMAKGRHFLDQRTPSSLHRAASTFRRVVELEPTFANAHADLALTLTLMADLRLGDRFELYHAARTAAEKALALDPDAARAHSALGITQLLFDWNFDAADQSLQRAIELDPEEPMTYQARGWLLSANQHHKAAEESIRRAIAIDPVNPSRYTDLGFVLNIAGKPRQAIVEAHNALELDAAFGPAYETISYAQTLLHDEPAAVATHLEMLRRQGVGDGPRNTLREAFDHGGLTAYIATTLKWLPPEEALMLRAQLELRLGETDRALAYVERAFDRRDWEILWLPQLQELAELRTEPRFSRLVRRLQGT